MDMYIFYYIMYICNILHIYWYMRSRIFGDELKCDLIRWSFTSQQTNNNRMNRTIEWTIKWQTNERTNEIGKKMTTSLSSEIIKIIAIGRTKYRFVSIINMLTDISGWYIHHTGCWMIRFLWTIWTVSIDFLWFWY